MPKFDKCPSSVASLGNEILCEFVSHKPLLDAKVRIDYVFAYPEYDEKTGKPISDALKHHGVKALSITRKLGLKDRAMGRGDAEVCIDAEWWQHESNEEERRALLDHELHHISVKTDNRGIVRDDLSRPVIKLRNHDFQVGWFTIIAERHGVHSQERIQAVSAIDKMGQSFWPDLVK